MISMYNCNSGKSKTSVSFCKKNLVNAKNIQNCYSEHVMRWAKGNRGKRKLVFNLKLLKNK